VKYQNLVDALNEANIFIEKGSCLLNLTNEVGMNNLETVVQGSLSASVRRSSLELTKALSKLRKSDWSEEEK